MGDRKPGGDREDGRDSGLRPYLKFMHLGTQMTLVLLAGVFGGIWLDKKFGTDPLFTVAGSLSGIAIGLAIVIRETKNNGRSGGS